jgi:hypothetical protein
MADDGSDVVVTLEGAVLREQSGRIDAVVTSDAKVVCDDRMKRIERGGPWEQVPRGTPATPS